MTKHEILVHRAKLGDTQVELGKRLGVTGRCVQYWEAGTRKVPKYVVIFLNKRVIK